VAALQRVRVGSVLDAVNGQAVGNIEGIAVVEMIKAAERPWRLLLRVSPPPMRRDAASPLVTQEMQRPLELALSQPALGSHERQEVPLAQLPGTSMELGSSRRDQRRRSSGLSAASSIARHYCAWTTIWRWLKIVCEVASYVGGGGQRGDGLVVPILQRLFA
jgi:hypothetical protein